MFARHIPAAAMRHLITVRTERVVTRNLTLALAAVTCTNVPSERNCNLGILPKIENAQTHATIPCVGMARRNAVKKCKSSRPGCCDVGLEKIQDVITKGSHLRADKSSRYIKHLCSRGK